jgi:uncharacterized protein (TIGR02611 family)
MPPGAEDHTRQAVDSSAAEQPTTGQTTTDSLLHAHAHHHHVLLEPQEDRWQWRRRIRENPRKLAAYRLLVGIGGLLLICLGFVSGPIPGPGGIPLVLLGLAVWASEFEWAHQLMGWFKHGVRRYHLWSRRRKAAFWLIFFSCCGLAGYGYLLILGVPSWLPRAPASLLQRLPGV